MKRLQRSSTKRCLELSKNHDGELSKAKKANMSSNPWLKIPQLGEGETEDTLTEKTKQLKKICCATRPDQALIKTLMQATYPIRRKMVIQGTESVESLVKMFPALLYSIHVSYARFAKF